MNVNKTGIQTDSPNKGLLARYPLTFYFIIAYAGAWLVWSLLVLSQDESGLLPFWSPMSYMLTIFLGQIFGPTMTWIFNNTKGSVLIAILAHASMDAFPNSILWPFFPAASKMTEYYLLYGYLGLALGFGVATVLIIIFTRDRLGYQNYRPANKGPENS